MKKTESPLQSLIDKMNKRINDSNVTTKKLAQIIEMAVGCREGLLQPGGNEDNDWWANKAIKDYTEIIVKANFKAHNIINPGLVPDNLDQQLKDALNEVEKLIQERDSKTVNFKNFLESYNKESDLVKKLTLMYDLFDDTIYKEDVVLQLIEYFNDMKFHLSEIKTVLVISNPFKSNEYIDDFRKELVDTYNEKKNLAKC